MKTGGEVGGGCGVQWAVTCSSRGRDEDESICKCYSRDRATDLDKAWMYFLSILVILVSRYDTYAYIFKYKHLSWQN